MAENVSKRGVQGFRMGGNPMWDGMGTKRNLGNYNPNRKNVSNLIKFDTFLRKKKKKLFCCFTQK